MLFLPVALLAQAEPAIPGWASERLSVMGSQRVSEHRKGGVRVYVRLTTFTSARGASAWDSVLPQTMQGAMFPIKNKAIEATGLRLFEFHEGVSGGGGKFVLNPKRPVAVHGAIGKIAYYFAVKMTETTPRKEMIREVEAFVPRLIASAKPSSVEDTRIFTPNGGFGVKVTP